MSLTDEQKKAVAILRQAKINSDDGMPTDLFLLASSLVPLPNVDLLVVNRKNQLLLSRRNDQFCKKSWHIPGGCMKLNKNFEKRIQETAKRELGYTVAFDADPLTVRNVIRGSNGTLPHPRERGYDVAILFRCYLPNDYQIDSGGKTKYDDEYLKWFDRLPKDLLEIQYVFDEALKPWK